jgi:hypothetical protein
MASSLSNFWAGFWERRPAAAPDVRQNPQPDRAGTDTPVMLVDRTTPGWARFLAVAFSLMIFLCCAVVAIASVFFESLVAMDGNRLAAPLIAAVCAIPVLGILVLDFSRTRSLAGSVMCGAACRRVSLALRVSRWRCSWRSYIRFWCCLGDGLGNHRDCAFVDCGSGPGGTGLGLSPGGSDGVLFGARWIGLRLAQIQPSEHALADGIARTGVWLSVLASLGVSTWLTAGTVVSPEAIAVWPC